MRAIGTQRNGERVRLFEHPDFEQAIIRATEIFGENFSEPPFLARLIPAGPRLPRAAPATTQQADDEERELADASGSYRPACSAARLRPREG
jgi:hypothetical protein